MPEREFDPREFSLRDIEIAIGDARGKVPQPEEVTLDVLSSRLAAIQRGLHSQTIYPNNAIHEKNTLAANLDDLLQETGLPGIVAVDALNSIDPIAAYNPKSRLSLEQLLDAAAREDGLFTQFQLARLNHLRHSVERGTISPKNEQISLNIILESVDEDRSLSGAPPIDIFCRSAEQGRFDGFTDLELRGVLTKARELAADMPSTDRNAILVLHSGIASLQRGGAAAPADFAGIARSASLLLDRLGIDISLNRRELEEIGRHFQGSIRF